MKEILIKVSDGALKQLNNEVWIKGLAQHTYGKSFQFMSCVVNAIKAGEKEKVFALEGEEDEV